MAAEARGGKLERGNSIMMWTVESQTWVQSGGKPLEPGLHADMRQPGAVCTNRAMYLYL